MRRAARFIRIHRAQFPAAVRADSATAVAVLAVKTYELFLDTSQPSGSDESVRQAVQCVMEAARLFDAGST